MRTGGETAKMTIIRAKSAAWIILALLPLIIIGCQLGIGAQPASTPLPPATPLPPDTPVPPPTPAPTVIQRLGRTFTDIDYATVNILSGPSDALGKLVAHSTVIIIGTVPNNEPESLRVQDQSNANVQSVANGLNIQVERYLKGSGGDTIPVIQFYGLDFMDRGQVRQVRDENEKLLFGKGKRYLLFLKDNESYPGYWSGTIHPYKFLLKEGRATAESPVGDLSGTFPEQSEADFMSSVESRIAGNPQP